VERVREDVKLTTCHVTESVTHHEGLMEGGGRWGLCGERLYNVHTATVWG